MRTDKELQSDVMPELQWEPALDPAAMGVAIAPGLATEQVKSLLRAGWEGEAVPSAEADLEAALAVCAERGRVLFVPSAAHVGPNLSRVVVPHDGTPSASLALRAAETVAAHCGAEIVVAHVASADFPAELGSLSAPRFVNHWEHDWPAWWHEFRRRFCQDSSGRAHYLEIAVGPPAEAILEAACRLGADLMVLAWHGYREPGRAQCLRQLCPAAPSPVLILKSTPAAPEATLTFGHGPRG